MTTETITEPATRRPATLAGILATGAITIILALTGSYTIATIAAPTGPQGTTGAPGTTGYTGPVGDRGPRGHRGRTGKTGKTGRAGLNGANGAAGATIIRDRACSNDIDVPLPYC